jgi:hypothetical protein
MCRTRPQVQACHLRLKVHPQWYESLIELCCTEASITITGMVWDAKWLWPCTNASCIINLNCNAISGLPGSTVFPFKTSSKFSVVVASYRVKSCANVRDIAAGFSAAVVRFHPVLGQWYVNPGPDGGLVLSGSLNFKPDHRERFTTVRFGFRTGSNHEPINFHSTETRKFP